MSALTSPTELAGQAVEPGGGAAQGGPVLGCQAPGCKACGGALAFGYGAESHCVGCEVEAFLVAALCAWAGELDALGNRLFRHDPCTPFPDRVARLIPADPSGGAPGGQRE